MESFLEDLEEPDGNYSMTCAARGLRDANNISLPISLATVLRVSRILYFSSLAVLGIILNLLVLILVMWSRKLRNRSFAIAVQIVLANLGFIVIIIIPTEIQYNVFGQPVFGLGLCIFNGYLVHTLVDVRVLLMFAYSLDRFASVFAPFLYPRHNLTITILSSVLAWFVGISFNLIGIPQILDCYTYSAATTCTLSVSCSSNCKIFQSIYLSAVIFPAMTASLIFIIALYIKGKKIRKQTSQMMGTIENYHMTDGEWKALKTFFLLVMTVIVVQVGIGLMFFLENINKFPAYYSPALELFPSCLVCLYFIIDPIAILKNADAREALKAMIKLFSKRQ